MHLDIKNFFFFKKKSRKVDCISRALNKFVISNKQNIEDNLGKKLINEQKNHKKELEYNENTINVSKFVGTNI
jgi:hypothetical protein